MQSVSTVYASPGHVTSRHSTSAQWKSSSTAFCSGHGVNHVRHQSVATASNVRHNTAACSLPPTLIHDSAEPCTSRRALLVATVSTGAALAISPAAAQAADTAAAQQLQCPQRIAGQVAAAFTRALYDALVQLQVLTELEFQKENYQLREREFKYYLAAKKDRMPAVPDLSDASGGLSEPLYFNFVTYIAWKVAARHVLTAEARTQLCQAAGALLLQQVWPQGLDKAKAAAKAGKGRAVEADIVVLIGSLLDELQANGYLCKYQIVWGEQPGGWPGNWMVSQGRLEGFPPSSTDPPRPGTAFQIKVHRPADIEGCIALRSEEDGFWSRSVSSMLSNLLAAAGVKAEVDEFFYQDEWRGPDSLQDKVLLALGDPLEQVGIDFVPTTLVQNWQLAN